MLKRAFILLFFISLIAPVCLAQPFVDPVIYASLNVSDNVNIIVKYNSGVNITEENEQEYFQYYQNQTVVKQDFEYIPETEMQIKNSGISALRPFFVARVNRIGLGKLVNDTRVTQIYLDKIVHASLPQVDPTIYDAFKENEKVRVYVRLFNGSRLNEVIYSFNINELERLRLHQGEFTASVNQTTFIKMTNDNRVSEIILAYNVSGKAAGKEENISINASLTIPDNANNSLSLDKKRLFLSLIVGIFIIILFIIYWRKKK